MSIINIFIHVLYLGYFSFILPSLSISPFLSETFSLCLYLSHVLSFSLCLSIISLSLRLSIISLSLCLSLFLSLSCVPSIYLFVYSFSLSLSGLSTYKSVFFSLSRTFYHVLFPLYPVLSYFLSPFKSRIFLFSLSLKFLSLFFAF